MLEGGIIGVIPGEVCVFLSSSHRGAVKVGRPGMKLLRYVTMSRNIWSLMTFVAADRACMMLTLSGSGWTPSPS